MNRSSCPRLDIEQTWKKDHREKGICLRSSWMPIPLSVTESNNPFSVNETGKGKHVFLTLKVI